MKIEFHPEAFQEYEATISFYEGRQAGLGTRFFATVDAALDSILESSDRWPFLEADVRRRLVRVFPYAVLYTVEPKAIVVVAIMHCHQAPGYWRSRVAS